MNWTGGHLQRHCITAGTTKIRQKYHFAEVRRSLNHQIKNLSPIKWSALESYTAQRLLSPLHQSQVETSRSSRFHEAEKHFKEDNAGSLPHGTAGTRSSQGKSKPTRNLHETLSHVQKRKAVTPHSLVDCDPILQREDVGIAEKKRRILENGDWVGIKIQKPLVMKYDPPDYDQYIGRRRPVTEAPRAKFRNTLQHLNFLSGKKSPKFCESITSGRQFRDDVRVIIDGKEVSLYFSSPFAQSTRATDLDTSGRLESFSSSDVMLLDHQDIRRQNGNKPYECDSSTRVQKKKLCRQGSGFTALAHPSDSEGGIDDNLLRNYRFCGDILESNQGVKNTTRQSGEIESSMMLPKNCRGPSPSLDNPFKWSSDSFLFSTSAASLQHPAPKSTKKSALLHCHLSDIADDVVYESKFDSEISYSQIQGTISELYITPTLNNVPESPKLCKIQAKFRESKSNKAEIKWSGTFNGKLELQSGEIGPKKLEQKTESSQDFLVGLSPCTSSSIISSTNYMDLALMSESVNRDNSDMIMHETTVTGHKSALDQTSSHKAQPGAEDKAVDQDEIWRRLVFGKDAEDL